MCDFFLTKTNLLQYHYVLKFNFFIFCLSRNLLENEEELLEIVKTFRAVSIKHNKQTDGASCGLHVIEV